VSSDMQILAMLKRRKVASQAAAEEARQAKRDDLVQKQVAEVSILEEYAGQVAVMPEEAIRQAVESVVAALRSEGHNMNPGLVIKELLKAGGQLDGKSVDKAQVATIVKELLARP
jgi:uncharacterized protein